MGEYFFGITDKGRRRDINEDTFITQEVSGEFLIACVIDGVGGYNGGEVAAEIARTVILQHLKSVKGDVIKTLQLALVDANEKISAAKRESRDNEQMACVVTCAVTHIKNNKFYYAHVGDTRLYLLRDNSLVKISKDHSAVGFMEDTGRLSEEDAMRHPKRNEINKALGFEDKIDINSDFIETGESPFLPGDIILLCSDGLSDMISSGSIMSVLAKRISLAQRAQQLVDAANEAGGNDNITTVLVENNKPGIKQAAIKPAERKKETEKTELTTGSEIADPQITAPKKNRGPLVGFLTILSVALLIALLVSLSRNNIPRENDIQQTPSAVRQKTNGFVQLSSHSADTSRRYELLTGDSLLTIPEPISISKDSFHLIGHGASITADSGYRGPAFIIDAKARHIVFDSIVFKNFDAGILVHRNNITFRHVRFINCRVPLQYQLLLPDSTISGRVKDSVFLFNSTHK